MKILVAYFSGTGNTERIAREIALRLEARGNKAKTGSVENLHVDSLERTALGLGFPSYGLAFPSIIERFVERLPKAEEPVPAFVFSTHAWSSGNSLTVLAERLLEKNIHTVARQAFSCPSNGARTFFAPGAFMYRKMVRVDPRLPDRLEDFAGTIDSALTSITRNPFEDLAEKSLANSLLAAFAKHVMEERMFRDFKVVKNQCIGCGKCVRQCPDGNLAMEGKKAEFLRDNGCMRCMRCISICPTGAILFGEKSRDKGRYTPEFRDGLFDRVLKR